MGWRGVREGLYTDARGRHQETRSFIILTPSSSEKRPLESVLQAIMTKSVAIQSESRIGLGRVDLKGDSTAYSLRIAYPYAATKIHPRKHAS